MNTHVTIERLTPSRFEEKAQVHALTWRQTYSGMLPDDFVNKITPEFALAVTRRHDPDLTLLALRDDAIIGFLEYLPESRDGILTPDASEIGALYVLDQTKHQGVGRALIEAALKQIPKPRVALSVLLDNTNAIGFYEHMGIHSTGHITHEDEGTLALEMTNVPEGAESANGPA